MLTRATTCRAHASPYPVNTGIAVAQTSCSIEHQRTPPIQQNNRDYLCMWPVLIIKRLGEQICGVFYKKIHSSEKPTLESTSIDLTCNQRYELLETAPIGKGSYGTVYSAKSKDGSEEVAIKVVELLENGIQPAEQEVRILKYLSTKEKVHRVGIAKLVHSWKSTSSLAIATVKYQGDFREYLARQQRLSLDGVISVAKQVLKTLRFFEKHNVIHGDLKPSNIVMTKEGKLKIIDMGLSQTTFSSSSPKIRSSTFPIQALCYRSPEILFNAKNYSTEVDVWSLGCILFEAYVGHLPFKARTEQELAEQITQTLGPIPYHIYKRTPKSMQNLLVKVGNGYVLKDSNAPYSSSGIRALIPRYLVPRKKKDKKEFEGFLNLLENMLCYDPKSASLLSHHHAIKNAKRHLSI